MTAEAENNLIEIGDWLAAQSPAGARKSLVAASNAIRSLKTSAMRNGLAPESRHSIHQMRQAFSKRSAVGRMSHSGIVTQGALRVRSDPGLEDQTPSG